MCQEGKERKHRGRKILVIAAGLLFSATVSGAVWFYRYSPYQDARPSSKQQPPPRAVAAIALANPQPAKPPTTAADDDEENQREHSPPGTEIKVPDPTKQFPAAVAKALEARLGAKHPELQKYLAIQSPQEIESGYRDYVFRFIDDAEKQDHEQQAAMLLAGDLLATNLWCPSEDERAHGCEELHKGFAERKLTMQFSELGGGSYYQHDLLWRLWHDYSDTDWGERAFVLLLNSGWDTSTRCAKGTDQFREVIKQGESFLEQRSNSQYRILVLHFMGEAYASWWALSNGPTAGLEDYIDPKQYREGAEEARVRAISYFQQVQQMAPQTEFAEYAKEMIAALNQRLRLAEYRFFCIYD